MSSTETPDESCNSASCESFSVYLPDQDQSLPPSPGAAENTVSPSDELFSFHSLQRHGYPSFEERVVDAMNYLLSPTGIMTYGIKHLLYDDMWVPICDLICHPILTSLGLKKESAYFVAKVLRERSYLTIQVHRKNALIRPHWPMNASLFISNVGPGTAMTDIVGLVTSGKRDCRELLEVLHQLYLHSLRSCSILFHSPRDAMIAATRARQNLARNPGRELFLYVCISVRPETKMYKRSATTVIEMGPDSYGEMFSMHHELEAFLERFRTWKPTWPRICSSSPRNVFYHPSGARIHLPRAKAPRYERDFPLPGRVPRRSAAAICGADLGMEDEGSSRSLENGQSSVEGERTLTKRNSEGSHVNKSGKATLQLSGRLDSPAGRSRKVQDVGHSGTTSATLPDSGRLSYAQVCKMGRN